MKFELIKDTTGVYRWRLLTNCGEPICNSVNYLDRLDALESINALRSWCREAPVTEVDLNAVSDWKTEAIKALRSRRR